MFLLQGFPDGSEQKAARKLLTAAAWPATLLSIRPEHSLASSATILTPSLCVHTRNVRAACACVRARVCVRERVRVCSCVCGRVCFRRDGTGRSSSAGRIGVVQHSMPRGLHCQRRGCSEQELGVDANPRRAAVAFVSLPESLASPVMLRALVREFPVQVLD